MSKYAVEWADSKNGRRGGLLENVINGREVPAYFTTHAAAAKELHISEAAHKKIAARCNTQSTITLRVIQLTDDEQESSE